VFREHGRLLLNTRALRTHHQQQGGGQRRRGSEWGEGGVAEQGLGSNRDKSIAYVSNPRREENNPESRFFVVHFMNPCTFIQRNPRDLPLALAECIPDSMNPGGGNEYRIRDCPRRINSYEKDSCFKSYSYK